VLSEHARDIVLFVRDDGQLLEANRAAELAYGYSRKELLALNIRDLRSLAERHQVDDQLQQAGNGGALFETVHRRKDGSLFPVEVSVTGVMMGKDRVLLSIVRDISKRKKAEDALREANQQLQIYEAIIQNAPDPILLFDRQYVIRVANPAYVQYRRKSADEIVGHRANEVIGEYSFQRYTRPQLDRAFGGEVVDFEAWFEYPDIGRRFLRVRHFPLPNDGGVKYVAAVLREETAHREIEQEREQLLEKVRRQSAELDSAIRSSADGLLIYGPRGEILLMNPAAERMLGYTEAERKLPLRERLELLRFETPEGKPLTLDDIPLMDALRGKPKTGVIAILHPPHAETLWVSISATPTLGQGDKLLGAVMTLTDITRLHELQQQRAKHVLGISHGLRTPLTVVQGQAQLLLRSLEQAGANGRMRRSTETIVASAQRMGFTLRDLVDLTSLESGQRLHLNMVPVDLNSFVQLLKEQLARNLPMERMRLVAPERLPAVSADPDRLERVLVNLLSNAFKFSEADTEVTLTLSHHDGEVTISVSDLGTGIPAELLPHLFDPYRQIEAQPDLGESTGLGLYISKGLVEAMGGKIWVESKAGMGSTFSFTLPSVPSTP